MKKFNWKIKMGPTLRKVLATGSIAAAMLAIANVEAIYQEYQTAGKQKNNSYVFLGEVQKESHAAKPINRKEAAEPNYKPLQSALSRSLEEDELQDSNPFAHLSTLDPLQKIMQKGVAHFRRETLRSPEYQEESGYDMLSYDVEHNDGTKSGILAYLEKVSGSDSKIRNVFVVFMVADGTNSNLFFFRSGELIEQSQLSTKEVQALVAHRLSQGIPFLSVSR